MKLVELLDKEAERMKTDEFFGQLAELFGLKRHDINPVSAHCQAVLEKGPESYCNDFRGMRRWVMCRAWQKMEEEKKPFSLAISEAWEEIKEVCKI